MTGLVAVATRRPPTEADETLLSALARRILRVRWPYVVRQGVANLFRPQNQTVAVTMRTPGSDFELSAGFLYGEGIIDSPDDVQKISYCVDSDLDAEQRYNIVNVELRGGLMGPQVVVASRHR